MLRLARQAWSYNVRAGLTGMLRFADGRFEQVLEGPSEIVLPLAARILTDPRHGAISIRGFRAVAARLYPSWTLAGFDLEPAPCAAEVTAANLCIFRVPAPTHASALPPAKEAVLGTV